jgi:hypothetical protein
LQPTQEGDRPNRKLLIRMMISLQQQIAQRTAQLDQIRREGEWSKALDNELLRLSEIQTLVREQISQLSWKDAEAWKSSGALGGRSRGDP